MKALPKTTALQDREQQNSEHGSERSYNKKNRIETTSVKAAGILKLIYDVVMKFAFCLFHLVWTAKCVRKLVFRKSHKVLRFIEGQQYLLQRISDEMRFDNRKVWWFHVASSGEYNVIKPIIKKLHSAGRSIVVTVFSPSGYSALKNNENDYNHLFYLPWDTLGNTRKFIDVIKPEKAVFAVSEYWINYLFELRRHNIPTYIVSMHIGDDSYLLRWYASPVRMALEAITTFMVVDSRSKINLKKIGFCNASVICNPLFDNVITVARKQYHNNIIERFCSTADEIFIAGSISDKKDLLLISDLANLRKHIKFIIVPREICTESLNEIVYHIEGKTLIYSECDENTDFSDVQVLVIDFQGALANIYRYGRWAYVGGGFTPYLHNIIEPVAYGLPVAFGPNITRKNTPKELMDLGIGTIVRSSKDILHWFDTLQDAEPLSLIRQKAQKYMKDNAGFLGNVTNILTK